MRRFELFIKDILAWSDAFYTRFGRYPMSDDGGIPGTLDLTWRKADLALKRGWYGLPGGSSLPCLLLEERGRRHKGMLPPFTIRQIIRWAEAHKARTGRWPGTESDPIKDAPGETWCAVDQALNRGCRGLPGGSSLPRLLLEKRGRRHKGMLPPFTIRQVLRWADAHKSRTGRWPGLDSGPIKDAPGETWYAVDKALRSGFRGQPGGSSLARLLAEKKGVRNHYQLPKLTIQQVLAWADAHYRRTGQWPARKSGFIPKARYSETWSSVDVALNYGKRGLAGYGSLSQLLARKRGVARGQSGRRSATKVA